MIADELRRQADNFIELSSLSSEIARHFHDSPRPQQSQAPSRRPVRGPSADFDGDDYDEDFDDEYDEEEEDDYEGVEAVVERPGRGPRD
jgi:hypothetical protein